MDGETIHASCVAFRDKAVLITGASGRGKSGLALMLMAMNCDLVADDRVHLIAKADGLWASAPENTRDLIEARGVGILNTTATDTARISLAVDLDETERERFPIRRVVTYLGWEIPLLHAVEGPHFAAAILQILKAGRSDR